MKPDTAPETHLTPPSSAAPVETPTRRLSGTARLIVGVIALAMTLVHTYTAVFGSFEAIRQRSMHLAFALVLVFGLYRGRKDDADRIPWYDAILMVLGGLSAGYLVWTAPQITGRFTYIMPLTTVEITVGIVCLLLLLEAARRAVGPAMSLLAALAVAYGLWGHVLPGELGHRHLPWQWIIENLFFTHSGVLGIPLGVSATIVFAFVLFGSLLEFTGAGQFFIDLASSLMGRYRGGPAKVAVVGSSLMGTLSGSAVANVVATGSFTIPLMKRTGYSPTFSAAVEAVASSGGQIMPPVMGATAFIIASLIGIPYIYLAAVAAVPALLYYFAVFLGVHFRAVTQGLHGLPPDRLPNSREVLRTGWAYLIPPLLLVVTLARGYTPARGAMWATAAVLVVGLIVTRFRFKPREFVGALEGAAYDVLQTAIATATAGIVVGMVTLSGVGLRFSGIVTRLAGGELPLALLLVAGTTIILGMGLPTVAAYIVQVALTVPALTDLGVPPLAAHLFVFYFAAMSNITPPVALAAFAGAGIAGADPMKVGWQAVRLGFAAYLAPFLFIYRPGLLLQGTLFEIVSAIIFALIGVWALAAAIEGQLLRRAALWERIALAAGGIILVAPGIWTDLTGLAIVGLVVAVQWRSRGEVLQPRQA